MGTFNPDLLALLTQTNKNNEEYSIPLDLSDLFYLCKTFNQLTEEVQQDIEFILEFGLQDAILSGCINFDNLPAIKGFFKQILANPLYGDAGSQAQSNIFLIDELQEKLLLEQRKTFN